MEILSLLAGLIIGAAYAVWRLKGERTWPEALRALRPMGGGGGGPLEPH